MKVTVKTDFITNNMNPKVEIYFSSKPSANVLMELKDNNWVWVVNKKCWSKIYNNSNLDFAMNLSYRFSKDYLRTSRKHSKSSNSNTDEYDDAFAYLRVKHSMKKRHDYGAKSSGAITVSRYNLRTRLVSCVL